MRIPVQNAWATRSPRDRAILLALAIMIALALYAALVVSADRARPQLRASVLSLRTGAIQLEELASEIERLRGMRPPIATQTDLRTLVQSQAAAAGLASALVRLDATDTDHVQVVFGAVAFSAWLNWVIALDTQQIRLEACRVEALPSSGMVSVTASFVRPARR
jgi:type II secretory pathway component PulM